jgi:hypothetical protein
VEKGEEAIEEIAEDIERKFREKELPEIKGVEKLKEDEEQETDNENIEDESSVNESLSNAKDEKLDIFD